ncbi:MAG: A/G-specific adenine glycosylase [Chloroflexi bacterium]|nr:A/G-specific adenine glycosylase [Chloroflexota bacterium]
MDPFSTAVMADPIGTLGPMRPDQAFDPHTALLDWYGQYQRDLPWRRDPTPYRVLVSEIMLHQTQVDRVVPFFDRFLQRFPTLAVLATASRAEVIGAWGGLGYNRRAVYLHELARVAVERYGGVLPQDRSALEALPGVGPYTAGAVLSIAFGQDEPAVDTNVERVIARYFGTGSIPKAALNQNARELVPPGQAREWNQALMDLGSSICRARAPRCLLCPLVPGCASAGDAAPMPKRKSDVFLESSRYYRGRMLAMLRGLAPGEGVPLSEIGQSLASQGVAEPKEGWGAIGQRLADDGLAEVRHSAQETRIALPS